jgi:peptidoglycan/LPS O-acetylase OafA/YrhL
MAYHTQELLPAACLPAARFGWMGVDLFFVLSGYLISCQLFKPLSQGRSFSIPTFYRRRAIRILPAYLAVMALYIFWPAWHEADGMSPLWQFFTFTENLFVDYSRNHAFSHVWSLCVEEHFYLLLPLVVFVLARKPTLAKTATVLGFFVAVGIVFRTYELLHVLRPLQAATGDFGTKYIERIYYPTYSRLDGLLAGVTLGLIRLFRPRWSAAIARHIVLVFLAGLALLAASLWMFNDRFSSTTGAAAAGTIIGFPILSLSLALLTAALIERRSPLGRIRIPGTEVVATLAYSLYLTHKEVAHLDGLYFPRETNTHDLHSTAFLAATCLIAAGILYFCIERPCLALRDRRAVHHTLPTDVEARMEPAL